MKASTFLKTFAAAAVVLAAASVPASAQTYKYTVCKDGSTYLSRARGVCGQHGGVDPKRSELANRTLKYNLPQEQEKAQRRTFEQRMKSELEALKEHQKAEREALASNQKSERQSIEAQKKVNEANQKEQHRIAEANKHAIKDNEKAIKKAAKPKP